MPAKNDKPLPKAGDLKGTGTGTDDDAHIASDIEPPTPPPGVKQNKDYTWTGTRKK